MNGMLRASLGTRGSPLPLTVAPVGEWCDLSEVPRADYRGCQSGRPFSRKDAQVTVHLLVVVGTRELPDATMPNPNRIKGKLNNELRPICWKTVEQIDNCRARRETSLPGHVSDSPLEGSNPDFVCLFCSSDHLLW